MVIFVCDATGAEVLVNNGLRELLSIKSVKVINVRDPKPGAWRLRVDSSSAHTLRITGLSKMDLQDSTNRSQRTYPLHSYDPWKVGSLVNCPTSQTLIS